MMLLIIVSQENTASFKEDKMTGFVLLDTPRAYKFAFVGRSRLGEKGVERALAETGYNTCQIDKGLAYRPA